MMNSQFKLPSKPEVGEDTDEKRLVLMHALSLRSHIRGHGGGISTSKEPNDAPSNCQTAEAVIMAVVATAVTSEGDKGMREGR